MKRSACVVSYLAPAALSFLWLCAPLAANAHEPGMVELTLDMQDSALRAELDLIDLDYLLGLDADADGVVSASEVGSSAARISDYVANGLEIDYCRLQTPLAAVGLRQDMTPSVVVDFPMLCDADIESVSVASRLFDELPDYRNVLLVETATSAAVFVLSDGAMTIDLEQASSGAGFMTFLYQGIVHILIGIDHLAFLLILVLPLAIRGTWQSRLRATAGIVTAFTVAHSITLTLSALGHLSLPARPVELAIAASVVFAACLNIVQRRHIPTWPLAYGFGLIHGFGFAGALGELAIADGLRVTDILAFNLGVEIGQLLVIAVALPILGVLAHSASLRHRLVPVGSLAVAALGTLWILERV